MSLTKALLSLAFAAALTGTAAAQTEIKLGHVGAPGSLFDKTVQEFAKRANAKLGNKAKVVVYGSSQLGSDAEMLKKLKLGTVDLALPSTVMSSLGAEFGLFEMPYLVKDRAHMARIREKIVHPILAPLAAKDGYHHPRRLGERLPPDHQQQAPDREAGRPARHQAAHAEGHLAREDVQGLWRQPDAAGVLGGVRRAADRRHGRPGKSADAQIYPPNFQEVQKYLSMSGHVYTPAYLTAGASWSPAGRPTCRKSWTRPRSRCSR